MNTKKRLNSTLVPRIAIILIGIGVILSALAQWIPDNFKLLTIASGVALSVQADRTHRRMISGFLWGAMFLIVPCAISLTTPVSFLTQFVVWVMGFLSGFLVVWDI